MAFYGYHGDVDGYHRTPYSYYNHDFAASPAQYGVLESFDYVSSTFYRNGSGPIPSELSVITCNQREIRQYDPIEYHGGYEYSVNPSEFHHSVHDYSEIKLLQYEPSSYNRVSLPSETKFAISYSAVEFNEPDFEEYDRTPYGGGYDPITTYGNPLPPSDKTCYPRSVPLTSGVSVANFSYGSVPSPYGEDDEPPSKNLNGFGPIDTKSNPEKSVKDGSDREDGEIVEQSDNIPSDNYKFSEGEEIGFENGRRGDYGYKNDDREMMNRFPYGSGLEAMDLCETVFGYWPCLAKREKLLQQQQEREKYCSEVWDAERRDDPWKTAADYLFGNPIVCNYEDHYR